MTMILISHFIILSSPFKALSKQSKIQIVLPVSLGISFFFFSALALRNLLETSQFVFHAKNTNVIHVNFSIKKYRIFQCKT